MGRFTPTGVGTIQQIREHLDGQTVHPHGRGDNWIVRDGVARCDGSPPRAWGQCRIRKRGHHQRRFTPTGVGTISNKQIGRGPDAVHPHGRGDNLGALASRLRRPGSPPRAWGQFHRALVQALGGRFTPTGVGTMSRRYKCSLISKVHPHGRGDNHPLCGLASAHPGSPPRAWGQCGRARARRRRVRFTPTGVGTMSAADSRARSSAVHPHGRGDNAGVVLPAAFAYGSPPRAWGQLIGR